MATPSLTLEQQAENLQDETAVDEGIQVVRGCGRGKQATYQHKILNSDDTTVEMLGREVYQ